jgi:hypothetical protein
MINYGSQMEISNSNIFNKQQWRLYTKRLRLLRHRNMDWVYQSLGRTLAGFFFNGYFLLVIGNQTEKNNATSWASLSWWGSKVGLSEGSVFSTKSSKNNYSHDRSTANNVALLIYLIKKRLVVTMITLKEYCFSCSLNWFWLLSKLF